MTKQPESENKTVFQFIIDGEKLPSDNIRNIEAGIRKVVADELARMVTEGGGGAEAQEFDWQSNFRDIGGFIAGGLAPFDDLPPFVREAFET